MSGKKGLFFDVLVLGGIIGAALAVLYTPFKGEDARKKIKEKIDEIGSDSKTAAEGIKENSQEVIQKTIESIEEGINRLTAAVEEAKNASDEKRAELEKETLFKGGE
jgi:gas vesicle protein